MEKIIYRNHVVHFFDNCPEEVVDRLKLFIDHFLDFQDRLGVSNWWVEFSVLPPKDNSDSYAFVSWHYSGRCATCNVSTELLTEHPEEMLARCAFHEVCELLLVDLAANLEAFLNEDYVRKMIHEVIRRLENFVFA